MFANEEDSFGHSWGGSEQTYTGLTWPAPEMSRRAGGWGWQAGGSGGEGQWWLRSTWPRWEGRARSEAAVTAWRQEESRVQGHVVGRATGNITPGPCSRAQTRPRSWVLGERAQEVTGARRGPHMQDGAENSVGVCHQRSCQERHGVPKGPQRPLGRHQVRPCVGRELVPNST